MGVHRLKIAKSIEVRPRRFDRLSHKHDLSVHRHVISSDMHTYGLKRQHSRNKSIRYHKAKRVVVLQSDFLQLSTARN